MGFYDVYNEAKALCQSMRQTLMDALVKERFIKMLDAIQKSTEITDTILTNIALTEKRFKALGKPLSIIAPSGTLNTPADSDMPQVQATWTGSTITPAESPYGRSIVEVPEITYDINTYEQALQNAGEIFRKYPIVLVKSLSEVDFNTENPDFRDYSYAYYYPDAIGRSGDPHEVTTVDTPVSIEIPLDYDALITITGIVSVTPQEIVGETYYLQFNPDKTGLPEIRIIYLVPNASILVSFEDSQGNIVQRSVSSEFVVYTSGDMSGFTLRIGDKYSFDLPSAGNKAYMLNTDYALNPRWIYIGDVVYDYYP